MSWIDLHALWKIVVVGIVAGAGLPALFAVGIKAMAHGEQAGDDRVYGGSPAGLGAAAICFAVVLAAIGWGIYEIVDAA